ncbi:MAG TPA: AAA family ATPase, partial [archaeon]|nr:AAA family ATPase [archaeon]
MKNTRVTRRVKKEEQKGGLEIYKSSGTVLSTDFRGYSNILNAGEDRPDITRNIPIWLLEPAEKVAKRNGGRFLKSAGDGELWTFGVEVPTPFETDAETAIAGVRSSLKMLDKMSQARDKLLATEDVAVRDILERARDALEDPENFLLARYGLGSAGPGELVFSLRRIEGEPSPVKDVSGNAMSIANKLQGRAKPGTIEVDKLTRDLAGDRFRWEYVGQDRIKGVNIEIYRPIEEIFSTFDVAEVRNMFFGREGVVAEIRKYLREGGYPVLLEGPMGSGKTATAKKAVRGVRTVKFGLLDRSIPYSLLNNLYRPLFGEDVTKIRERLSGFTGGGVDLSDRDLPYIAIPMGLEASGFDVPSDPEARNAVIADTFSRLMGALQVVILDDVDYADPLSQRLIENVSGESKLVMTSRPGFEPKFPVNRIALDELERENTEKILKGVLGDRFCKLDQETVEAFLDKVDGNPFFATKISVHLREKIETGGDPKQVLRELPDDANSYITSRIQEYGPEVYKAFRYGAHLGRPYWYIADLEEVAGVSLDQETIENMRKSGLVGKTRQHSIEVDEKLSDALLSKTTPDKSRRIHREFAEYFERLLQTNKNKALLLNTATQYSKSDQPEKAVTYLLELGKIERSAGATETSVTHLARALEILDANGEDWNTQRLRMEVLEEIVATNKDMRLDAEVGESSQKREGIARGMEGEAQRHIYRSLNFRGDSLVRTSPEAALPLLQRAKTMAQEAGDEEFVM